MIQHLNSGVSQPVSGPGSVAVVIVSWNRRDLLLACLRSLTQPQDVPFEVILVDNGSEDGSAEAALELARNAGFPLRVIRNRENRGFCAANNQGIAAAEAEFIALLNNDAEAEPRFLYWLRAAFEAGAGVGMAAAKILVWEDPRIIDKAGHLIWLDGQNRGRGSGQVDAGQFDQIEEVLWPDGCACMYRKSMLDQIGGFDEDLFAYGDDADLGLRARIAGWRCIYTPQAAVRHHRGSTLGVASTRRLTLIERNRVLLAAKLFPGTLLWRNGIYFLARIVAGARAAMRNRGEMGRFLTWKDKIRAVLAVLAGDLQAIPMLPRTLRKRREINRIRKLSPSQVALLLRRNSISLKELSESAIPPSQHPRPESPPTR